MRPQSIERFELAFVASIGIGLINLILFWDTVIASSVASVPPDAAAEITSMVTAILIGVTGISFLISIALWYFIAYRASQIARGVLLVFALFGILGLVMQTVSGAEMPLAMRVMGIFVQGLNLLAVAFLFKADANAWFASGGKHDAAE